MREFEGFTLDWYKEVFQDTRLLIIVLNTLIIALLSAAYFNDYWRDRGTCYRICEAQTYSKYAC